jgi:hypothetical protein
MLGKASWLGTWRSGAVRLGRRAVGKHRLVGRSGSLSFGSTIWTLLIERSLFEIYDDVIDVRKAFLNYMTWSCFGILIKVEYCERFWIDILCVSYNCNSINSVKSCIYHCSHLLYDTTKPWLFLHLYTLHILLKCSKTLKGKLKGRKLTECQNSWCNFLLPLVFHNQVLTMMEPDPTLHLMMTLTPQKTWSSRGSLRLV